MRARFLHVGLAVHEASNPERYVAVERRGAGMPPRLLRREGFNALCEARGRGWALSNK